MPLGVKGVTAGYTLETAGGVWLQHDGLSAIAADPTSCRFCMTNRYGRILHSGNERKTALSLLVENAHDL